MKTRTLIILLAFIVLGAVAFSIAYRMYHKPHPDYAVLPAQFQITAEELFEAFITDASEANQKYTGKMIELSGVPDRLEEQGLPTAVFVMGDGMFGEEGIRCVFLEEHRPSPLAFIDGSPKVIKGFCSGYNETDVLIEKCIWVQE